MIKILLSSLFVAALSGCATVPEVSIDANSGNAMKGKTVAFTTRVMPKMLTVTPADVLGSPVALFSRDKGADMVLAFRIEDPSIEIGRELMAALQAGRGTVAAGGSLRVQTDNVVEIAAAAKGNADYILDVSTTFWMFSYFPFDFFRYQVHYQGNARLIDTATGTVVANGKCKSEAPTSTGAPRFDDFEANNAEVLKREIARSVRDCVATFKTRLAI